MKRSVPTNEYARRWLGFFLVDRDLLFGLNQLPRALYSVEMKDSRGGCMLTFLRTLVRGTEWAAVLLVTDALVSSSLGLGFVEILGDLMLVEVGVLFVLAGLIDFASSIGAAQFRKTILKSKEGYSDSKHKESERRASIALIAGVILFLLLILAAIVPKL
jgi:hypothetical protein